MITSFETHWGKKCKKAKGDRWYENYFSKINAYQNVPKDILEKNMCKKTYYFHYFPSSYLKWQQKSKYLFIHTHTFRAQLYCPKSILLIWLTKRQENHYLYTIEYVCLKPMKNSYNL